MSFWQKWVLVPGIMSFLAACSAKKPQLGEDVMKVIVQIRDFCNTIINPIQ